MSGMSARQVRAYALFFAIFVVVWLAMSALFGDSLSSNVVQGMVVAAFTTGVVAWQTERRRPGRR